MTDNGAVVGVAKTILDGRGNDQAVRLVRMAGALMVTGAVFSFPASLSQTPQPPTAAFLLPVATTMAGIATFLLPARLVDQRWIPAIVVIGIAQVMATVQVFGRDYGFYYVLVAIYGGYALVSRRAFAATLAAATVALFFPAVTGIGDDAGGAASQAGAPEGAGTHEGAERTQATETATHAGEGGEGHLPYLVTFPVMLISGFAVRDLRETLVRRQNEYRAFASEAIELAMRITPDGANDGEQSRLAELERATRGPADGA